MLISRLLKRGTASYVGIVAWSGKVSQIVLAYLRARRVRILVLRGL
jgi:hypothetical protein